MKTQHRPAKSRTGLENEPNTAKRGEMLAGKQEREKKLHRWALTPGGVNRKQKKLLKNAWKGPGQKTFKGFKKARYQVIIHWGRVPA